VYRDSCLRWGIMWRSCGTYAVIELANAIRAIARRVRRLGWSGNISHFEFDKDSIVGLIVSILNWTDLSRVGCGGAVQCVEVQNLLIVDGILDISSASLEM